MIDLLPNVTVVFQWAIFMAAFVILHFGIFRPALKIIERRRAKTVGEKETAERLNRNSQEMQVAHESRMEEARREGIRRKETLRVSGEKTVEDLLKKTRSEVEASLEASRGEIDRQSKEAALQLRQQARELGHAMAEKILERTF